MANSIKPFPVVGDQISLIPIRPQDADDIYALCQDPNIQHWTTVPSPYLRKDAVFYTDEFVPTGWGNGFPTWGVRLHVDDTLMASIGLMEVADQPDVCEVGYWMGSQFRGHGYMTQALRMACDAAFNQLGVSHVLWRADEGNWPSWRTAWKVGFTPEGGQLTVSADDNQWHATLQSGTPYEPQIPWNGPDLSINGQ